MVTTAASRRARRAALAAALCFGVSCIRADTGEPAPEESPPVVISVPERASRPPASEPLRRVPGGPEVRVGLAVNVGSIPVGGAAAIRISGSDGNLTAVPAGVVWRAVRAGDAVALVGGGGERITPAASLIVAPAAEGGFVRIGSREYRGVVSIVPARSGLSAINQVGMEEYLVSVVGSEMGRRTAGESEALRAQAIVSRTYALRTRGRWRADGFDYYATVADQVYLGAAAENALARDAVESTRGTIVSEGGAPIDAFFFSTCGGRTEQGTEVFRAASRSYLRSVADVGPDGRAWCAISPRYQWHEEWDLEALRATLRRFLPAETGVAAGRVTRIRDIRIAERTGSGRVRRLVVALADGDVAVPGPSVREVLRPASGDILRSTAFTLRAAAVGGEVTHLSVDGSGAGHGVGFCQWGAVGRARAGYRYPEIIAAYYPGTSLERYY